MKEFEFLEPSKKIICYFCNEDYSERDDRGGCIFGSVIVCPTCSPDVSKLSDKYKYNKLVRGQCPRDKSFRDWVISKRKKDMRRHTVINIKELQQ